MIKSVREAVRPEERLILPQSPNKQNEINNLGVDQKDKIFNKKIQ